MNKIDRFKFRYWHIENEYMCYLPHKQKEFPVLSLNMLVNKDIILMQSTGIYDKDYKLIYEGDILLLLKFSDEGNLPVPVLFKAGAFGINLTEANWHLYKRFYSFNELFNEIGNDYFKEMANIGNIFEDPDEISEEEANFVKKEYFNL